MAVPGLEGRVLWSEVGDPGTSAVAGTAAGSGSVAGGSVVAAEGTAAGLLLQTLQTLKKIELELQGRPSKL